MTAGSATTRGLTAAAAAYALWGLIGPVGKVLLVHFDPLALNAVRATLLAVVLWVAIGPTRRREAWGLLRQKDVVAMALVGYGLSFSFTMWSLDRLDPVIVTVVFYSAPLWTAIFARRLLGERVGVWFLPAALALMVGAAVAVAGRGGWEAFLAADGIGVLHALGAAVTWALYTVLLRRRNHAGRPELPLWPLMAASFLVASAYFWLAALVVEGPPQLGGVPGEAWAWMAVHAAYPGVAAFALFSQALRLAGAGPVNLLVGVELLGTVFFAWLLYGGAPDAVQWLGILVVVAAVTGYLWRAPEAEAPEPPQAEAG
ncbi:MAG: DMT family transporter [Thermoplasmatota archaeon]